nr:response regulator transcription factor [Streptomyces oceani]
MRVLVADDNPVVRAGLHSLLQGRSDLRVVAEASDGREAYDLAGRVRPDAILLDVRMPGVDGITALPQLARLAPVMMLTYSRESEIVYEALRLGARGYLVHGEFTADELVSYVRDLTRGRAPFTATSAHALLEQARSRPTGYPLPDGLGGAAVTVTGTGQAGAAPADPRGAGQQHPPGAEAQGNPAGTGGGRGPGVPRAARDGRKPERTPPGVKQSAVERRRWATSAHTRARRASYGLSEREVEIMELIASGMTNPQIAATCFISEKTVKNHINRIFTKLDASTRSQAIARWLGTIRAGQDW